MKHKNNSNYKAPIVILVRPQLAENIGMVARSMMNCGLSQLRLVNPREDHLSQAALSASSGAQVVLEEATVFSTLEEAISDLHYVVATTARIRGISKPVYGPNQISLMLFEKMNKKEKVGLLFGPERTGLENSDLIFADSLLTIPLNPIHPSLNLAQAVLLTGWIWWQENLKNQKKKEKGPLLASKKELNFFLNFLIQHLEDKNTNETTDFIISLLASNVDARLFEIVSYSILKFYYKDIKSY